MLETIMKPDTYLLRKEEAARRLRLTLAQLDAVIAAGHLTVVKLEGVARGERIREADLERYVRGGGSNAQK